MVLTNDVSYAGVSLRLIAIGGFSTGASLAPVIAKLTAVFAVSVASVTPTLNTSLVV